MAGKLLEEEKIGGEELMKIIAEVTGVDQHWTTAARPSLRRTQEGCGGLRGENPGAFPNYSPVFPWRPVSEPRFGVGRRGSPRFVLICADSPFSSDLFFGNTLICSDLFRSLPICSHLFAE